MNGKRTELSLSPNIEMNKVYWIAFSAYIHDWGTLATNDNSLFGTQLHQGNKSLVVGGPAFGLYTTQTGRTFRVQSRYSESATPSYSNAVSVKHAEYPIPFHRWTDFVIKFKQNTSGNGFLQVWMDGQMIADYTGSLGYNTGYTDYAKFGYYNWTASEMNSTPRKVLLREPTIVNDPTGRVQPRAAESARRLERDVKRERDDDPRQQRRVHQHERRGVLHGPVRSHAVTEAPCKTATSASPCSSCWW